MGRASVMNNKEELRREDTQNPKRRKISITLFADELTLDIMRTPTHTSVDDLQPKACVGTRGSVTGVNKCNSHVKWFPRDRGQDGEIRN
jgi:hypothetical protein